MKRLDNKVAIVTGASKGIGAGIAKAFGAEGAAVVVNYTRDDEGAGPGVCENTSNSAVDVLLRVLSTEFGPRKIRVNALNPGGTETEGAHAAGVMGTEFKKQIIASTSLGRVGQP